MQKNLRLRDFKFKQQLSTVPQCVLENDADVIAGRQIIQF